MDDKIKGKINKLAEFAQKPELAIWEAINDVNDTLKIIAEKETPDFPAFPEIPEPKETDLTETNTLLQNLLDKEDEPVEISVELIIT